MKLEVKYPSQLHFPGANVFIYQLSEGVKMGKILGHVIRM